MARTKMGNTLDRSDTPDGDLSRVHPVHCVQGSAHFSICEVTPSG